MKAPRPNLLQLLAQPEFAIVREDQGNGPFRVAIGQQAGRARPCTQPSQARTRKSPTGGSACSAGRPAPAAVQAFLDGKTDLVLGGTFGDLPYAQAERPAEECASLRSGGRAVRAGAGARGRAAADREVRRLLSEAIDRQAIIDALNVPGLLPRATLLEPGLDGIPDPAPPSWLALPIDQRRTALSATAARLFGELERPVIRIALPDAPGAKVLLSRLASDWGALGIQVERRPRQAGRPATDRRGRAVDLPGLVPAPFPLRTVAGLRPGGRRAARRRARGADRRAAQRSARSRPRNGWTKSQLFIALAAPIRWSLVSTRVQGFATNRFARHTLTSLRQRLDRERSD